MDISRLSSAPAGRPAGSAYSATARSTTVDATAPSAAHQRARSKPQVERVVQGELLQREPARYQSTRAFIDERGLEYSQSTRAANPAETAHNRAAIALYLNNARPDAVAESARGRAVNYFV